MEGLGGGIHPLAQIVIHGLAVDPSTFRVFRVFGGRPFRFLLNLSKKTFPKNGRFGILALRLRHGGGNTSGAGGCINRGACFGC